MRETLVRSDWRGIAILASIGAAGIHFGAAREHFTEYAPAGAFMLVAGIAQFVWALWVARRGSERILEAGMAANAGIVVLWIASRTVGLPLGAMPGVPEDVHGTDVVATVLEIVIVIALARSARGTKAPSWALLLTAIGVLATLVVGAHDPSHERLVAAATLVLAATTAAVSTELARTSVADLRRRSHETSFARRAVTGLGAVARAGGGARG